MKAFKRVRDDRTLKKAILQKHPEYGDFRVMILNEERLVIGKEDEEGTLLVRFKIQGKAFMKYDEERVPGQSP
jgi:hypothetical protein